MLGGRKVIFKPVVLLSILLISILIAGIPAGARSNANGIDVDLNVQSEVFPVDALVSDPIISTVPPYGVTATSATFIGNLNSLGSNSQVSVSFEYGKTTDYGHTTSSWNQTNTGLFSISVNNLEPFTTYHFRAKAVGTTTSYSADSTLITASLDLSVSTLPATWIEADSAYLNGNLNGLGDSTQITVLFEWGRTTSYGNTITLADQYTGPIGPISALIQGLLPGTEYHFRAKVAGNTIVYGEDMSFITLHIPPVVSTGSTSEISTNTARVSGNLVKLGEASTVKVSFEYGLTPDYGNTSQVQSMSGTGAFSTTLTGLLPGKLYYFRAKADGGTFGVSYGVQSTFQTSHIAPSVATNEVTDNVPYSATFNGTVTSMGSYSNFTVYFQFGTTTSYGTITGDGQPMTQTGKFSSTKKQPSLLPNTLYHYRAVIDLGRDGLVTGQDMTFTTAPAPPIVRTNSVSNLDNGSATLNGFLSYLGSATSVNVCFEYGPTNMYGQTTQVQLKNTTGGFSANISGLTPNTLYHFRAKADGGTSGIVVGNDMTLYTSAMGPDGKIAFTSEREGQYQSRVYIMNADGSGQTRLSTDNNTAVEYAPSSSPDGTRVAFYSNRGMNNDIYVVDLAGNITRLTTDPASDAWPAWSPDGNKIAFVSQRDESFAIYVMNPDGTQQTRLADGLSPRWLPDGSIVFNSNSSINPETYIMNADGSNQRLYSGMYGAWSRDGRKVAFTLHNDNNYDIYVADADGSNQIRLTDSPENDFGPVWSPDGKQIAFYSNRDSQMGLYSSNYNYDIYIMNADGTNQTRITTDGSKNTSPSWTVSSWDAPAVISLDAVQLSATSCRLNGDLTSLGQLSSVNVSFVITDSLGNAISDVGSQVKTSTGFFSHDLADLIIEQTIYYRAKVTGSGIALGEVKSYRLKVPNATVTLGNLNQTYDGQPRLVTYTTNPAGLTAAVTYNGSNTAPVNAGNYSVAAAITSPDYTGSATGTLAVDKGTPIFSNLRSPTINKGAAATSLSGKIKLNTLVPGGNVAVTLNGVTLTASINTSGDFTISFATGSLEAGFYPITYSYAGDGNFNSISDSSCNLTVSASVSPTPTNPVGGGTGGGGGFGGGGFGGGSDQIYLSSYMGSPGVFSSDASIKSPDGMATLTFPQGTNFKTVEGWAGSYVTSDLVKDNIPAPPAESNIIGPVYQFGPQGSTFNPPIGLSIVYDPAKLPSGVDESNLKVGYWDGTKWQVLDTTLDMPAHTLTAKIGHFSQYAVISLPPPPPPPPAASFNLSPVKLSVDKVNPGEMVTAQTTVSNTGGSPGSYIVVLKVNGVQSDSLQVNLDAGKSQTVIFRIQKDAPGEYSIQINGYSARFSVLEPPAVTIIGQDNKPVADLTSTPDDNAGGDDGGTPAPAASPDALPPAGSSLPPVEGRGSIPMIPIAAGIVIIAGLAFGVIMMRRGYGK